MSPSYKGEETVGRTYDKCIANILVSTTVGIGSGALASYFFLKKKSWPVFLLGGFGFGVGTTNCRNRLRHLRYEPATQYCDVKNKKVEDR